MKRTTFVVSLASLLFSDDILAKLNSKFSEKEMRHLNLAKDRTIKNHYDSNSNCDVILRSRLGKLVGDTPSNSDLEIRIGNTHMYFWDIERYFIFKNGEYSEISHDTYKKILIKQVRNKQYVIWKPMAQKYLNFASSQIESREKPATEISITFKNLKSLRKLDPEIEVLKIKPNLVEIKYFEKCPVTLILDKKEAEIAKTLMSSVA